MKANSGDVEFNMAPGMFGANSSDSFLDAVMRQIGMKYAKSNDGWSEPSKYGCDFEDDIFEMHYDRQDYECTCGATEPLHSEECQKATRAYCDKRWKFVRPPKPQEEIDRLIKDDVARGFSYEMAAMSACCQSLFEPGDDEKFVEFGRLYPYEGCVAECPALTWKPTTEHSRMCCISVSERPCFTFKATGLEVNWYKYIGRDMKANRSFSQDEIAEIALQLLGRTLNQVAEEHARDSKERADQIAGMFKGIGKFGGIQEEG